jgi:hypothetical protein
VGHRDQQSRYQHRGDVRPRISGCNSSEESFLRSVLSANRRHDARPRPQIFLGRPLCHSGCQSDKHAFQDWMSGYRWNGGAIPISEASHHDCRAPPNPFFSWMGKCSSPAPARTQRCLPGEHHGAGLEQPNTDHSGMGRSIREWGRLMALDVGRPAIDRWEWGREVLNPTDRQVIRVQRTTVARTWG